MLSLRIVDTLGLLISATNAIRIALISQNDGVFLLAFPHASFIILSPRGAARPGCYRDNLHPVL
jgi:hypothetical protein